MSKRICSFIICLLALISLMSFEWPDIENKQAKGLIEQNYGFRLKEPCGYVMKSVNGWVNWTTKEPPHQVCLFSNSIEDRKGKLTILIRAANPMEDMLPPESSKPNTRYEIFRMFNDWRPSIPEDFDENKHLITLEPTQAEKYFHSKTVSYYKVPDGNTSLNDEFLPSSPEQVIPEGNDGRIFYRFFLEKTGYACLDLLVISNPDYDVNKIIKMLRRVLK